MQEFDDFCDNQGSARHAMNFVITAYHLHEWVWKDYLKNDALRRQEIGIAKDFKAYRDWLNSHVWYAQMEPLANGSKHFRPAGGLQISTVDVGPLNSFAFNEGAYNEGYSYFVLDMGMHEGLPHVAPAAMLFEAVMRFWRDFLLAHSPYTELPKGRTKLMDDWPIAQP
ncbi:hypothetical protein IVA93_37550 (plasmid) [Bradyrhizobium sp. 155]|uniref:hypothetical protein n=1 Tax=Bradyrhizobium sp. 155 TaxID=2782629 RepID=UPI001FFE39CA|nr:hypothetical protein [Bradyrhizobium sp. 155]UPK15815.1 hypothetical protein IVA93_37550 [Bradyrhizobium sp. 155]